MVRECVRCGGGDDGERVYSNLIDITIPFFTIESIQKINLVRRLTKLNWIGVVGGFGFRKICDHNHN